jgi:hypothetical protein
MVASAWRLNLHTKRGREKNGMWGGGTLKTQKNMGQDVVLEHSQIGTGKVLYPNPYGTAKTLLLGRFRKLKKSLGPDTLQKLKI